MRRDTERNGCSSIDSSGHRQALFLLEESDRLGGDRPKNAIGTSANRDAGCDESSLGRCDVGSAVAASWKDGGWPEVEQMGGQRVEHPGGWQPDRGLEGSKGRLGRRSKDPVGTPANSDVS